MVERNGGEPRRSPGPLTAFVVGGLSSLIPVGRARGAAAVALVGAPAGLVAASIALYQRHAGGASETASSTSTGHSLGGLPTPLVPALAGAVVGTGSALGILFDRLQETTLRRRGVRHPRLVIALVGAVGSALITVLERRKPDEGAGAQV